MDNSGHSTVVSKRLSIFIGLALISILLVGAYLRFIGLNWGEYQYLHPDERFLIWVGSDISPVEKFSDYWNTATSSLNPHNRGHSFYVYGTLPLILTRYVVEWVYGHSGFNEMTDLGRMLSAVFDLSTVLLVFLIGRRVYNWRVGLLASAFYSLAVLPIQHAHFFTMDTFTTFFAALTIFFAVLIAYDRKDSLDKTNDSPDATENKAKFHLLTDPLFLLNLGFGLALGMAMASKINSAPLALLLPVALYIRLAGKKVEISRQRLWEVFFYLVVAGLVTIVAFRIFQPYAFSGPGFFGVKPNPAWLANLNELRNQGSGDVDFPPAMQWARRPVWFAWENMVRWGMGLPLGLLAWAGFLWAGWRILKGEWQKHVLLWGWTGLYFIWQSLIFNPSMRYQLLIYPTLAIFAAWALVRLYDWKKRPSTAYQEGDSDKIDLPPVRNRLAQTLAILIGGFVLVGTAVYAIGFTNIYQKSITRVAASRWIYQNIPGPITIPIKSGEELYNQQLSLPYNYTIRPDLPYFGSFTANRSGTISEVQLGRVINPQENFGQKMVDFTISETPAGLGTSATASGMIDYSPGIASSDLTRSLSLQQPFQINPGQEYFINIQVDPGQGPVAATGSIDLSIQGDQTTTQTIPFQNALLDNATPYSLSFVPEQGGQLTDVSINLLPPESPPGDELITVTLSAQPNGVEPLSTASYNGNLDNQGDVISLNLNNPVTVQDGQTVYLTVEYAGESEGVTLKGTAIANEGAWDDGLPVRLDNYDGFGGIYESGLNFDMYEDDNPNKLARFYNILDQAEYILISSNRQWGSLPRLPERFPMTAEYYRRLLGCPQKLSIQECYNVAQPGDFQGDLGFELIQVFQSDPTLGGWSVNDQFAEEAFTVYDHPKVFIFKKLDNYDSQRVRDILGAIDLTKVIHVTPKGAESLPGDMLLTSEQSAIQLENGTWSDLFDTASPLNRWPYFGLVVWYLALSALGWLLYPVVRFSLPGLSDKGFPLSRIVGLLVLSYIVWLAGSLQIPFTRLTITLSIILIASISICLTYWQKDELRQEFRDRRKYFLLIEGLFLALFIFDLLIRLGNPDLWHPWKGGERPMDFSFFNAILKSTVFPPYDPWFAGGYINYYYYGFVLVGVLVKWLGIVPSVAYNLIIPTVFSLIAMGAFSIGWNLMNGDGLSVPGKSLWASFRSMVRSRAFIVGSAAALGMALIGNLGTIRMILVGYQKVAAPGGTIEGVGFLTRMLWTFKGAVSVLSGAGLPYGLPDWYWLPSRVIPAPNDVEPITEFPFFTVLYGDPHAHLFALPLTLLVIAWGLSVLFSHAWSQNEAKSRLYRISQILFGFLLGGLAIGVLRPTNTWDFPTYLALGMVLCGYAIWKYYPPDPNWLSLLDGISPIVKKAIVTILGMAVLVGLSFLLFRPYAESYVQGYTKVDLWKGTHTPLWSYLTHWGVFLFVLISWMGWETRDWMANTPLRAVRKLEPYKGLLFASIVMLFVWVIVLILMEVSIGWLVLPLAVWAGLLLLKPGLSDSRRVVLVLVGGGLLLTLLVEVIVLRGDIGRMNTVFKFYLQVWTLFAISAAAGLGWLLEALPIWNSSWRTVWKFALGTLVFFAALYPLLGGTAKIKDRMSSEAPHTLDGMAYMQYAEYDDLNTRMDLNQDYQAIRWLQENVKGSPVIIEGNMVEYHWGTRNTIYTGLPNVIGWNWHERQQRSSSPENLIADRISEVNEFYLDTDPEKAMAILDKYGVEYIIVGQLEQALYPGPGLDKFEQMDGLLWQEVFRAGSTVIYQVIRD